MQPVSAEPTSSRFDRQQQELARAFTSFTQAASSLERSYAQLQSEVVRLRRELEEKNRELSCSLEENQRMREYLDRMVEGLPCGVLVIDSANTVRLANPEAHRLLSLDEGTLDPGATLPTAAQHMLARVDNADGEREFMLDAFGTECWVAVRRAPLATGQDRHTVFILRDITDQKRLEAEREQIRRHQALVEMSAVLAHEIRNPLGSLELFANLLAENDASASDRADWIAQIQGGVRALAATVNNVLHFHSPPPASLVPCDLGELLDRAAEFVAPLTAHQGLQLEISNQLYGLSRPADPHRLQQVLLNLVLNALRFTPAGGRILLTANAQPEASGRLTASLQIRDTGTGIAPEHLKRIFTAGFSTRGSPGLGLAVCKKIVEQHGGTISAASPPGQGATFTVRLPLS